MSRGVDVLAVMDESTRHAEERGNIDRSDRLKKARAAVAELIDAAGKIANSSPDECGSYYTNRANIRIAKEALARVRGAA